MKKKSKSETVCVRREIILLDVDCFEVQVWCNNRPELEKVPVIVASNPQSVKIVSVNYMARSFGVKRSHSLEEAQRKCPGLIIVPIPDRWGKQDQRPVLQASYKIKESVKDFFQQNFGGHELKIDLKCREEFYIDITPVVTEQINSGLKLKHEDFYQKTILEDKKQILGEELKNFIDDITDHENLSTNYGLENDTRRLLFASVIAGKLIDYVLLTTGFQTSAGVARNKLQTKLACVLNRPKSVTTILDSSMENISKRIPIENINGLGGSRGRRLKEIFTFEDENTNTQPVSTMFHLRSIPAEKLTAAFGKKFAFKILEYVAGEDFEPVENRGQKNSTSNERYIFSYDSVKNPDDWNDVLQTFSAEMTELLEEEKTHNGIRAVKIKLQLAKISETEDEGNVQFHSGSLICPIEFTRQDIHQKALKVLQNWKENGFI